MSPIEAKEALVSECRKLHQECQGLVPSRILILRLEQYIEPLVKMGIRRFHIWAILRSAGLESSFSHVADVLAELFGPAHQRNPGSKSRCTEDSFLTAPAPVNHTKRSVTAQALMSFGDEQEALEQEERLARVRAEIEAERQREASQRKGM